MADTQRTYAQVLGLLADNLAGDISAQDIRDAFVSWRMPMGQIWLPDGSGVAIACTTNTEWYEVNGSAWTSSSFGEGFDESAGEGRLTYVGTVPIMVHAAFSVSFTSSDTNAVVKWRLGVDGTTQPAGEAQRLISSGATDVGSTALHLVTMMDPGQYLSAFAQCENNSKTVTPVVANVQAVGMVM